MIPRLSLRRRIAARFRKRINRAPSPVLAHLTPWVSVMLGSLAAGWLTIANAPVMPPFGFLLLLGWRQLHPGLLPVWAGLPLGLIDDLVSGQPAGSGVLQWSLAMLALEVIETRWPWRSFAIEWVVAAAMIAVCLLTSGAIASGVGNLGWLPAVALQVVVSVLAYPVMARIVAWFDRLRLVRFRKLG